jgi:phenylacetate-CoA ligase
MTRRIACGAAVDRRFNAGARHLPISAPLDEQIDWLAGLGRVYLNTLPSNAMALAQRSEERGVKLQIAAIMTVGERLSADVRDEVLRVLGCRISDVYATAEAGLIAIECPETGAYHLNRKSARRGYRKMVICSPENGMGFAPCQFG